MTAAEFGLPVYTHPTTSGNKHIPSGGSSGQILRWSADGTATWGADNNTTYSNFVKSGSSAAAGLVPKPSTTAGTTKFLREDCSWQVPPMANSAMPSNAASISITLPATGVESAAMPYDGYVWFHARCNSGKVISIMVQNTENWLANSASVGVADWEADALLPVRKGQKVMCHYISGDGYEWLLRLCPCVQH